MITIRELNRLALIDETPIHFLDFDACETVCGISDTDAPKYVDPFGDGAGVTCPTCLRVVEVGA